MARIAQQPMRPLRRLLACVAVLCTLATCLCLAVPKTAYAVYDSHAAHSTVRIGVVEQVGSAKRDENGVLRGFDAEYLARIAQYAQFNPVYVFYDDFDSLLDALERGEIQMSAGISKTPEREEKFLFTKNKIGSGSLNLRVRPDDDRYEYGNIRQIATMKVGAISGSIMADKALEWTEEEAIDLDLTEFAGETELVNALYEGQIDGAFVNSSVLQECRQILKLDATDYFVVFGKDETQLKNAVDSAMNRIINEDLLYFEHLESKYQPKRQAPLAFSADEKAYLYSRISRPLKVAVIADDAPYCETRIEGPTGIVVDFYNHLANIISSNMDEGAKVSFTFVEYPDTEAAIAAVVAGEADILGMTCIDATDAGQYGLVLTSSYSIESIVGLSIPNRPSATLREAEGSRRKAAVIPAERDTLATYLKQAGEPYDLATHPTLEECHTALETGKVDLVITSSARANWLVNQHRSSTFVSTAIPDQNLPVCAAVAPENAILGRILSEASADAQIELGTIIASDTAPRSDVLTIINRLPVNFLIGLSVFFASFVGGIVYSVVRMLHTRELRRKDNELIDAQKQLLESYEHDALTGLINRLGALRRINDELCGNGPYSMAMISIDNVRTIDETFGHGAGDEVVRVTAQRLLRYCKDDKDTRIVYRYAHGVYLLVVKGVLLSGTDPLIDEIGAIVQHPIEYRLTDAPVPDGTPETETIRLRASIGIATSDGTDDPEHVIRACNMAADQAHQASRHVYTYSKDLQAQLHHESELQDKVMHAVEDEAFCMLYQPQVDLRTWKVNGYEALVRMKDGSVSPGEFIPIAESNGLIRQIGRTTTRLVVEQLAAWREEGIELLPVSINYSSLQMGDDGYLDFLLGLLETHKVDPSLIKLEITERLVINNEMAAAEFFDRLQSMGIQILMDDFGTGYSSLNYLAYIPVDVIKLDKAIVDAFLTPDASSPNDERGNDFVRNIVHMTHDLDKEIIVEGVEERWQVDLLASFGCDAIQGFYFSRPLPADEAPKVVVRT